MNGCSVAALSGSMRTVEDIVCDEDGEEKICPVCLSEI